jgi:hypothetical protein
LIRWKNSKADPWSNEPLLRLAKKARDDAALLPLGNAKEELLNTAEASELAVIDRWLSVLNIR